MKKLINTISSTAEARLKNPFSGTFIASWIVFNWKPLIFFISSNKGVEEKLAHIVDEYSNYCNILLYPLISTIFFLFIVPWINKYNDDFIKKSKEKRETSLHDDEIKKIQRETQKEEENAKREIAVEIVREQKGRNQQAQELREKIEILETELTAERSENLELSKRSTDDLTVAKDRYNILLEEKLNLETKLTENISEISIEVRSLREGIHLKDLEIETLNDTIKMNKAENTELNDVVQHQNSAISEFEKNIENKSQEINELNNHINNLTNEISPMEVELNTLRQKQQDNDYQNHILRKEKSELIEYYEPIEREISELRNSLEAKKEEMNAKEEEHAKEIENLKINNDFVESEYKILHETSEQKDRTLYDKEEEINMLKAEKSQQEKLNKIETFLKHQQTVNSAKIIQVAGGKILQFFDGSTTLYFDIMHQILIMKEEVVDLLLQYDYQEINDSKEIADAIDFYKQLYNI